MFSEEVKKIWNSIQLEVKILSDHEPILSIFFYSTLLKHEYLDIVLCSIISKKLAHSLLPAIAVHNIIKEAYHEDPKIIMLAVRDILSFHQHDPAVDKYSTPLLYLKGFHSLQSYRIIHLLFFSFRDALSISLQNTISLFFGVDIHPAATIGCGIMLDHATGIVIGENSVLENNVSLLHSVTLGCTGSKIRFSRHPTIRECVIIGAGAKILGNIEVGKGAKIGAGSVVLQSIPPHTTAAGVPARIVSLTDIHSYWKNL